MHAEGPRTQQATSFSESPISARKLLLLTAAGLALLGANTSGAQDAWLLVPVAENLEGTAPTEAILAPWENNLQRVVRNHHAAQVYEQRHSVSAPEPPHDRRDRAMATIDRALQQLALGNLDTGAATLRAITELSEIERDTLLHSEAIAQKLFDACLMRAYLLARQDNNVEAKHQLRTCAVTYPHFSSGQRGFAPSVHGPPQLKESFDQVASELAQERSGTLRISSAAPKPCKAFVNGLFIGDAPVRLTGIRSTSVRVQLQCDKQLSRSHRVLVGSNETHLQVDPRFDANLLTSPLLQLRYSDRAQREAFAAADGKAIKEALGIEHVALLAVASRGQAWTIRLMALEANKLTLRPIGEIEFSEAAGYDPKQLGRLIEVLTGAAAKLGPTQASPAPVKLTAPPLPPLETTTDLPPTAAAVARSGHSSEFPTIGVLTASLGVIGLATSWLMFAERRGYRLREWNSVGASDEAAYARRGAWTMATLAVGSAALALSPYFLLPEADAVPTFAWLLGGVGIAVAAIGVGMTISDEHCGPEIVLPLREPCRSVRADSLFGIEIALTALPLVTLPFNYLLRSQGASVGISYDGNRRAVSLQTALEWL